MQNLRRTRAWGEACSFDRVWQLYTAGRILGAKPQTQFQIEEKTSNRELDLSRLLSNQYSASN